jgi:hypothetical protein
MPTSTAAPTTPDHDEPEAPFAAEPSPPDAEAKPPLERRWTLAPCDLPTSIAEQVQLATLLAYARQTIAHLCSDHEDPAVAAEQTKGNVLLVFYAAKALDIPVFTALQEAHIINGKVGFSAIIGRALAERAGFDLRTVEENEHRCVMRVWRNGVPLTGPDSDPRLPDVDWQLAEAQQAGLVKDGSNWRKYPRDMLFARCSSRALRRHCAGVTMGLVYSDDEMAEIVQAGEAERVADQPAATAGDKIMVEIAEVGDAEALRKLWHRLKRDGTLPRYNATLMARAQELNAPQQEEVPEEPAAPAEPEAADKPARCQCRSFPETVGPCPNHVEDCGCHRATIIDTGQHQPPCPKAPPTATQPPSAAAETVAAAPAEPVRTTPPRKTARTTAGKTAGKPAARKTAAKRTR